MCGLCLVSLWYLNCLHWWKEVSEFQYQISTGYWLVQVIFIFKCYLYQYLKESIRKHSSKINSTKQTDKHSIPCPCFTDKHEIITVKLKIKLDRVLFWMLRAALDKLSAPKMWQTRMFRLNEDKSNYIFLKASWEISRNLV